MVDYCGDDVSTRMTQVMRICADSIMVVFVMFMVEEAGQERGVDVVNISIIIARWSFFWFFCDQFLIAFFIMRI